MWAQVATSSPDVVSLQVHIDLVKEFNKYRTSFVILFDLAQAACFIFLSIVFFTAYVSKNVHRSAPWFMFIGSAMVWTGTYLLILGQQDGALPPFAFCVFQASLVYACNTFVTSAALALVCDMTFKMRAAIRGGTLPGRLWNIGVLTLPPLVFLSIFIWTLLIGLNSPELVELDSTHMFCHILVSLSIEPPLLQPFSISAISTLIPTVFLAIFSVWNAWIILSHRKRTGLYPSEFESAQARGFSWTPFIRRNILMALLSLIGIVMGATAFHAFTEMNSPIWNIALVFMPFAISALMGTRMDLLMVWFPKLRRIVRKAERRDAGHI